MADNTHKELPAHASPALAPQHHTHISEPDHSPLTSEQKQASSPSRDPPANIISPAFTPPSTPGSLTPSIARDAPSIPVDSSSLTTLPAPKLLEQLPHVQCVVRARIPTTTKQEMWLHLYKNDLDNKEHLAIVFGDNIRSKSLDAWWPGDTERERLIRGAYAGRLYPGRQESCLPETADQAQQGKNKAPMVRIHSECYTGETVWSARCDCGEQLDEAARLMCLPQNMEAGGVIIYLRQEGRGIGLGEKLKAYNLQDLGHDTYEANILLRHPADSRSYGLATAMLVDLGLGGDTGVRLLTNNPEKIRAIEGPNREVVVKERVAMVPLAWKKGMRGAPEVERYLETKIEKFKHMIG